MRREKYLTKIIFNTHILSRSLKPFVNRFHISSFQDRNFFPIGLNETAI